MPRARTAASVSREIDKSYRDAKKLILNGLKQTKVGSRANLDHVRALADLDRRHRQERADRGIDAQNLFIAAKTRYTFVATVDGALMDDHRSAGEKLMIEQLERDFSELPPPQVDDENEQDQPPAQVADEELDDEEEEDEPEEDLESYGN